MEKWALTIVLGLAAAAAAASCVGGEVADEDAAGDPAAVEGGAGGGDALDRGPQLRRRRLNGCLARTARDARNQAHVTIHFPGTGSVPAYNPKCVKVSPGTRVTFEGDFAAHPLQAGVVHRATGTASVDRTSPIDETKTGTSATFRFDATGRFGYFCERHFQLGMDGAVFVQ